MNIEVGKMILRKHFSLAAMAMAALVVFSVPGHSASEAKDTVLDKDNKYVVDSKGNCVRTKWMSETDPCQGYKPAPKPSELSRADKTIYFNFDSSVLTKKSKKKLNRLARSLTGSGEVVRANIVGYADHIGNDSYNMALSKRRAKAVKRYLASKGYVDARVVEVRALGESASRADCRGKKGKALKKCLWKDRKVEVELEYYSR